MTQKIDRYIFWRLLTITVFVLGVLIFIFIVIDFSDHSDDFTDKGATFSEIFGQYYLNYIPEMIRLVIPVAVFVACLYLTGQMADRLEIVALKAAGVSLYRLILPYLTFAFIMAGIISYLDGFIIPDANSERIKFEQKYLPRNSERVDGSRIFRRESDNRILLIEYYNPKDSTALRSEAITFAGDSVKETLYIPRMEWRSDSHRWKMTGVRKRTYTDLGFTEERLDTLTLRLNIYARDLERTTSDIPQLTYPEARDYIASIERSGATGISRPQIQFYGRLAYPLSIVVVTIIGFSLASVRRRGGKGFYIASGLAISFLYLAFIEVIKPFGAEGEIHPFLAAFLPHLFFLFVGWVLLYMAKK